jgi:thioredoxin 1
MLFMSIFKGKKKENNFQQNDISSLDWPEYIVSLDKKTFENFIKKYPLSIVDFWSTWCAPCKIMEPRLRRLSKLYKRKVAFAKIDLTKNKDIADKYKIIGIPHLLFFNYGKKVASITGVKSVGYIKNVIENIFKK